MSFCGFVAHLFFSTEWYSIVCIYQSLFFFFFLIHLPTEGHLVATKFGQLLQI